MEKKQSFVVRVFLFLSFIAVISACNNKESARLKINMPEYSKQGVIIEETRVGGKKFIDSLNFSSKGKLSYKFELKQPVFYNLLIEDGDKLFLLVKPEDKLSITRSDTGIVIKGSDDSQKLTELYDKLFETRKMLDDIRQKYNLSIDPAYRDSLEQEYIRISKNHYNYSVQFVLENLTSLVSMASLYQELSPNEFVFGKAKDMQFFKLVSDSLLKYYPKHRHVLALKRNFNNMYDKFKIDKILSSATITETDIPELNLPDTKEKMVALTSLAQRYVLLNFWNQNDQLSNEFFPAMNKVHTKYKKNFTIYNVYLGKSIDNWRRIIAFEEIESWVNVADINFPNSNTKGAYNIQSLPTNFLIDQQEKTILAKDINPTQLNQKLSGLLDN
jgi:hypothetical protein